MTIRRAATGRSLKQHGTRMICHKRRSPISAQQAGPELFDLPANLGKADPTTQLRFIAALMKENSRLVDQLRCALRDLQLAQRDANTGDTDQTMPYASKG
jgi:hypothetical protein